MSAVSGCYRHVEIVFDPFFYVGDRGGLIETSVLAAAAAQLCDAMNSVTSSARVELGAEDLASKVGEIEEVCDAVEVHIHYRNAAGNGPFHFRVTGTPDQIAGFGIDDIDSVAHLIGGFAILVVVMVIRTVAPAEHQCGYGAACDRHPNESRGGPGLPHFLEACVTSIDLPFQFWTVRIGDVQRIEVPAPAAHAAVQVHGFWCIGEGLAGLAPGRPAGIKPVKLPRS